VHLSIVDQIKLISKCNDRSMYGRIVDEFSNLSDGQTIPLRQNGSGVKSRPPRETKEESTSNIRLDQPDRQ
jgi:hypothetical protein